MSNIIKLPGLIDTHVHLREPGATQKEDFETGTKAAVAGGYTLVLDMPNNPNPIINPEALQKKIDLANGVIPSDSEESVEIEIASSKTPHNDGHSRIYCDLGFHFGGSKDAVPFFEQVKDKVFGLKVYMNHTTGPLLIEESEELDLIFSEWPKEKPLMVHAEEETLAKAIILAKKHGNRLHVCHIARRIELELIRKAKSEGLPITCEVTMHHLYLTHADEERLKHYGMMRPPLASQEDVDYLWSNINSIDIIASDHAPHTKEEKDGEKVVNGVPGLETTLPLLLQAVNDKRLTINDIQRMCHDNPKKIFNIPEQIRSQPQVATSHPGGGILETYVEVDMDKEWTISNDGLFTKCGWTPFEGLKVKGKVMKTVIRGKTVFENSEITGEASGKIIYPES